MIAVSVIIPVYGVEKYIERCARSLFEQTLKDIEYIFVNDCTPDNSIGILERVIEDYPSRKSSVKIVTLDKNSGQAIVRRIGISHATGEYIIHCDSDDWVDKNMYSDLYLFAKSNNYDIVKCDFYREGRSLTRISKQFSKDFFSDKYHVISNMLIGNELTSMVDKLVSRNIVHDPSIVNPEHNMQEDFVYCLQYVLKSNNIGYLNKPYYYYCFNSDSISHQVNESKYLKRFDDVCNNTRLICDILERANLLEFYRDEIICSKYNNKCHIIDLIDSPKYYRLWLNTYPEINNKIFFNKKMRLRTKILYFTALLHMYSATKKFVNYTYYIISRFK